MTATIYSHTVRAFLPVLLLASLLIHAQGFANDPSVVPSVVGRPVLVEQFDAATGTTPPSGWRNRTLSGSASALWRFDNPQSRAFIYPIVPPAAIFDFADTTLQDVVLETPAFDASSSHRIVLSFDHSFFADSSVQGQIEVFDGYNWFSVLSVSASFASTRHEDIDISTQTYCAPNSGVRFRRTGSGAGFWIVDNVVILRMAVTAPPPCVAVASPENGSTNVSVRAALAWNPNAPCPSGYKLFFGTNNPPTNILDGYDVGNLYNFPPTSRLSYNTTYYWQVVPYNAVGSSTTCGVRSFTTGENPVITSLPFSENWEGSTYGWYSENTNSDGLSWWLTNTTPRSPSVAAIIQTNPNGTTPANDWLYTAPVRMHAGHQYRVDFWYRVGTAAMPEALEVKWGVDQHSSTMVSVPVFTESNLTNTSYAQGSAFITAPDSIGSSDINIGWHCFSQAARDYVVLDDITITDIGLQAVVYASFAATRSGSNAVVLNWRMLSQEDNQQFEIQKSQAPSLNFQTIANSVIPGGGTTSTPANYTWTDNNAASTATFYRIKQTSVGGAVSYSNAMTIDGLTSVSSFATTPTQFTLSQNYPNPFNPETRIDFAVPSSQYTTLNVYNVLGQIVATLFNDVAESGRMYTVTFAGAQLPSGIYFYKLESGTSSAIKKLVLLK